MKTYRYVNVNHEEDYYQFEARNLEECRHWAINHLDQSKEWELILIEE